jgi:hypothetical protein
MKLIEIDPVDIVKNRLSLNVRDQEIKLLPGLYYIGYKFYNRSSYNWKYKYYLHAKEKAKVIAVKDGKIDIQDASHGAYQFNLKYHKVPE